MDNLLEFSPAEAFPVPYEALSSYGKLLPLAERWPLANSTSTLTSEGPYSDAALLDPSPPAFIITPRPRRSRQRRASQRHISLFGIST